MYHNPSSLLDLCIMTTARFDLLTQNVCQMEAIRERIHHLFDEYNQIQHLGEYRTWSNSGEPLKYVQW
jgi:hypothetical protein